MQRSNPIAVDAEVKKLINDNCNNEDAVIYTDRLVTKGVHGSSGHAHITVFF